MRLRLAGSSLALLVLCSLAARAGQITDVADAMDPGHPVEVDLDVGYERGSTKTPISRETKVSDGSGGQKPGFIRELDHTQTVDELEFRLGVGLYHDLELHILAPLVLRDLQTWDYADAANSTLKANTTPISGCYKAGSCPLSPPQPIGTIPGRSLRQGFRDPTVGIAWGPINEEREAKLRPELFPPGKPVSTWVIGFDYTLPLPIAPDDPSAIATAPDKPAAKGGPEAKRAHLFTLWTAFSKRFRVLDPYVRLSATVPVPSRGTTPGDGAYDNCWHPEALADVATANCKDPAWIGQTGYQPSYEGSLVLGTELVAAEDPLAHQKLAFDLRGSMRYVSPGRVYSQVTDALGKLTYVDEYTSFTASLGLYGRISSWLHLRARGWVGFDTAHTITNESIGKDLDSDGIVQINNGSGKAPEQNPTYDYRLDTPGSRLKAEASFAYGFSGTLSLNF